MSILVIAEKPSVGINIANVLGITRKGNGYVECGEYIVSWCIGHLVEFAPPEAYGDAYKVKPWNVNNLPIIPETENWKFNIISETNSQFQNLKALMNSEQVNEIICATDAGREGECIFRYVYNLAKCHKPVKRLWISSVEEIDILQGFQNLRDDSEFDNLFYSGHARAKADWLVGMNGTRLFSAIYNNFLSVGRVQTPTLNILVKREKDIQNFISQKYYTVVLDFQDFKAESEKIEDLKKAEDLAKRAESDVAVIISVESETKKVSPPKLFNLADLQKAANRLLGYTASQTLIYAQSLYEKKLITYPRTDSNYANSAMQEKLNSLVNISKSLMDAGDFEFNVSKVINDKKVTDHHALLPTLTAADKEIIETIPESELKILKLICSQLIYAVSSEHIYETRTIILKCAEENFKASDKSVVQNGWKEFQPYFVSRLTGKEINSQQKFLPQDLAEGLILEGFTSSVAAHQTSPPKHYTDASLISAMECAGNDEYDKETEKKGIGTQATQASIIETIIKRGYVVRSGKNLIPTQKGINLIKIVPEDIKSPKTTALWENKLQLIEKGMYSKDVFVHEIEEYIKELVDTYGKPENVNADLFQMRKRKIIGKCPKCGNDVAELPKSYKCEKCDFNIWKKIAGKIIPEGAARSLIDNGRSAKLKGFSKKDGGKFSAALILDSDFNVKFKF